MKKWELLSEFNVQSSEFKVDELIKTLLANRGITEETEIDKFIHPQLADVTIASVGLDTSHVEKTIKRVSQAISEKERIVIFGDYDVDGITGTAILWETLNSLGANVMPYIPHRLDEGYGLSIKGIEHVLEKYPDTTLIITVDNGIMAHEAVAFANEKKLQVIITDHHTPESEEKGNPKAYAIVHTTKLCGAGVAYLLSKEIRNSNIKTQNETENVVSSETRDPHLGQKTTGISPVGRNDQSLEDEHLELATLGTIADLVPLTGANRAIVKHGLKNLCETRRPGLLALFQEAACDRSVLGVYEVGHIIAPRLNAAGRLESAMDSLRLLCTRDTNRAKELALQLGQTNTQRQLITKESTHHASMAVQKATNGIKKLLVIGHEDYQPGVIGLIAGRLVEEYYRPAIVLSIGPEFSKASVRSINGFNIIEFLRKRQDLFVNLGGHPMAAGFTIETANLETLKKALEDMGEEVITDDLLVRKLKIDAELPLRVVTFGLFNQLQQLAPFGMSNPEPVFVSRNVTIADMKLLGKERNHLKLVVQQEAAELDAIGFGLGELAPDLHIGDRVDIAYTADVNEWNGRKRLQLKMKDIQLSSSMRR